MIGIKIKKINVFQRRFRVCFGVHHEPLAHDVRECRIIVPSLNILALNFNPMDVCIIDTWHASTDVVHCSLSLSLFNHSVVHCFLSLSLFNHSVVHCSLSLPLFNHSVVHCSLSLSLFNYSHLASRALIAAILSASALLRCGSGKEK